jgi:hypothetical protein
MKNTKGRPLFWTERRVSNIINQARFHAIPLKAMCKHAGVKYNSFIVAKRKYYGKATSDR